MHSDKNLIFCEFIDSKNTPVNQGKIFELGPAGVNIKFFLPEIQQYFTNGSTKFIYEIFRVNVDSTEEYEDTVFAELNPMKNAQADFTFYKSGKFKIKIYDSMKKNLLNSGILWIKNSA